MNSMVATAELVLNSYDDRSIDTAISKIKKSKSQLNVELGDAVNTTNSPKGVPKIWGCQKQELKQKVIPVKGSPDELRKLLLQLTVTKGVYIQLLPHK